MMMSDVSQSESDDKPDELARSSARDVCERGERRRE